MRKKIKKAYDLITENIENKNEIENIENKNENNKDELLYTDEISKIIKDVKLEPVPFLDLIMYKFMLDNFNIYNKLDTKYTLCLFIAEKNGKYYLTFSRKDLKYTYRRIEHKEYNKIMKYIEKNIKRWCK